MVVTFTRGAPGFGDWLCHKADGTAAYGPFTDKEVRMLLYLAGMRPNTTEDHMVRAITFSISGSLPAGEQQKRQAE